jgi:hypothetical protein
LSFFHSSYFRLFIIDFTFNFFFLLSAPGAVAAAATPAPAATTTPEEAPAVDNEPFSSVLLSLVKTTVMFVGEMDYTDIVFHHWLGYVIWAMFVFLLVIVLMNILNGLAVSDIGKIQEEVDKYYNISIVESLAHSSFVSLLAEEIVVYPNLKPVNDAGNVGNMLGISLWGKKVRKYINMLVSVHCNSNKVSVTCNNAHLFRASKFFFRAWTSDRLA